MIIRIREFILNYLLLALIAFFATWGEGMQLIISKASLIYPALVSVYIFVYYYSFIEVVRNRQIVPHEFKILFLFILIHTFFYVVFNAESIGFGTESGDANDEGYAFGKTDNGVTMIRYFLFLLFSLYLTVALGDEKKLRVFAIFYVLGFVCTVVGGASHSYQNAFVRFSGGLQDPNTMAFDALISFVFSLFLLNRTQTKWSQYLLIISIVIEIFAVFLSFSRGAFLALMIWMLLYAWRKGILQNIWKWLIILVFFLVIGNFTVKMMDIDTELLEARFSLEEISEDKGANRGLIWEVYLSKMDEYFVTGMGMCNSPQVMVGNDQGVAENYESHNLYIQFFAEFGFVGLLLYLLYWRGFIKEYLRTQDDYYILMTMGCLFMVVTFFLNIDKGRTFWIVLSVINMVWMKNMELENNEEVDECQELPQTEWTKS